VGDSAVAVKRFDNGPAADDIVNSSDSGFQFMGKFSYSQNDIKTWQVECWDAAKD